MGKKYEIALYAFSALTVLSLIGVIVFDATPDSQVEHYFAGGILLGLVGIIGSFILGQRVARAHMVDVHGEETAAAYEKSRKN